MKSTRLLLASLLALTACAHRDLSDFEHNLAGQDSATAALRDWCDAKRIAQPATIVATSVGGGDAQPPVNIRAQLDATPSEPLGYRHVRLWCGGTVLSEAHNWYIRGHLTPEMNQMLAHTDTPFGIVASPLHFTRERLASRHGRVAPCPPRTILSHRALLRLPDRTPLALVIECYTRANLTSGRGH